MNDYQPLEQTPNDDEDDQEILNLSNEIVYRSYRRRWFYLFVVCLAQISNAIVRDLNNDPS